MEDFKFLTDAGANVQIDPVLFARHNIHRCTPCHGCSCLPFGLRRTQAILVARGDVSLRYALDALHKEASEQLKAKPESQELQKALKLIEGALDRLGDRP